VQNQAEVDSGFKLYEFNLTLNSYESIAKRLHPPQRSIYYLAARPSLNKLDHTTTTTYPLTPHKEILRRVECMQTVPQPAHLSPLLTIVELVLDVDNSKRVRIMQIHNFSRNYVP